MARYARERPGLAVTLEPRSVRTPAAGLRFIRFEPRLIPNAVEQCGLDLDRRGIERSKEAATEPSRQLTSEGPVRRMETPRSRVCPAHLSQ